MTAPEEPDAPELEDVADADADARTAAAEAAGALLDSVRPDTGR